MEWKSKKWIIIASVKIKTNLYCHNANTFRAMQASEFGCSASKRYRWGNSSNQQWQTTGASSKITQSLTKSLNLLSGLEVKSQHPAPPIGTLHIPGRPRPHPRWRPHLPPLPLSCSAVPIGRGRLRARAVARRRHLSALLPPLREGGAP